MRKLVFHLVIGRKSENHVHVLVRFFVHPVRASLSGEGDQGRAVQIRVRHAGKEVGRARPQGGQTHARLASQPAINVGHEGRALFVARRDKLDGGANQRIHHIHVFLAGDAEDIADTLVREAFDD